jgi:hypothetical protein
MSYYFFIIVLHISQKTIALSIKYITNTIRVFKNQHQSDQVEAEEEDGDVEEVAVAVVVEEEEDHREGKHE